MRTYSKKELAIAYAPELTVRAAVNRLMAWLKRNPQLMDELYQGGYRKEQRIFTIRQVNVIFRYLGEPD